MNIVAPVAIGFLAFLIAAWVVWKWNTRKTQVRIDAPIPDDFPSEGFSHEAFERLLSRFTSNGRIDYERWHREIDARRELDSYLAAVARFGPDTTPERFDRDQDALAYWMYAYNALVIRTILQRWPLKSVTDLKAPIEIIKGLGFFYNLEFAVDGHWYTLYAIEHERVTGLGRDPRVHFVLNCGSEACPAVRPELPTGDALEPFLEQAARDFIANPKNVSVDRDTKTIRLSAIFKWYKKDFVGDLQRRGLPSGRGVIAYVESMVSPELAAQLADSRDFKIAFVDYDWRVNVAETE